jgi:uncharacterized protein YxeA
VFHFWTKSILILIKIIFWISFFLAVAIVVAVLWTNTVTGQTQSTIACEGSTLKFNCPASQTIQVTSAVYGRSDSSICCNDANVCKNTNCKTDVTTIVSGICNLLNICSIPGASGLFGDPCVGTSKYVKVDYNCVSGIDSINYVKKKIWILLFILLFV